MALSEALARNSLWIRGHGVQGSIKHGRVLSGASLWSRLDREILYMPCDSEPHTQGYELGADKPLFLARWCWMWVMSQAPLLLLLFPEAAVAEEEVVGLCFKHGF